MRKRYVGNLFGSLMLAILLVSVCFAPKASAAVVLIQTTTGDTVGGTSVTATFGTGATTNNLLVAVCGGSENAAINGPSGFSTAINQTGTPTQGIFYKISTGGETGLTCSSPTSTANNRMGMQIYEYSGIDTATPYHTSGSATGTGTSVSSGSLTTTNANTLLLAGLIMGGNTAASSWTNSFTERNDFASGSGNPGQRRTYAGADRIVTSTGTYSTAATAASTTWRGQIVAFNALATALTVDIVNASGVTVASPSVAMTNTTAGFACGATTGTLGVSAERIRVQNTTATPTWTVTVAATSGATASWSTGSIFYDFNDGSGAPAGCADGGDADSLAGRLTISPAASTLAAQSGCTTTGLTRGSNTSFAQGTTDSITLLSAGATAGLNCYWDLTAIGLSQQVPAEQRAGSYAINMTLTVTAT